MILQNEFFPGLAKSMRNFTIGLTGQDLPKTLLIRKLGLVCEGGGQRGIFTAGILDAFLEQNYFPFHVLIGVSAGAQNLSSYACGVQGYSREAITRFTTTKTFFNPMRFARGGHLIDLDWYFDALNAHIPLSVDDGQQRLQNRLFQLCVSRRDTLQAEYLPFQPNDLLQTVKASSALPILFREPVLYKGVSYWDGGVADSVPVKAAHDAGCDCIVVIRTQPRDAVNVMKLFSNSARFKRLQELGGLAESYIKNYGEAMDFIDRPEGNTKVIDISPIIPLQSSILGSSQEALLHDYKMGQLCGNYFLDHFAGRIRIIG